MPVALYTVTAFNMIQETGCFHVNINLAFLSSMEQIDSSYRFALVGARVALHMDAVEIRHVA